jgi:hypothetical protein
MSQAIQHNSQVAMTRHRIFYVPPRPPARAESSGTPADRGIEAHADAAALNGWRADR